MSLVPILKTISPESRSQQIERTLLDLLATGEIVSGQRLPPEVDLAKQFGVSRATVREAIARLRADGVVSTKPGRGAVVESRTPLALRFESIPNVVGVDVWAHIFELRQIIEIEAAGLSAKRHTDIDLAAMEAAFREMAEAAQQQLHAPQADLAFHRALAAATHNPQLLALVDFIAAKLDRLLEQAWDNSARHVGGAHHAQAEHGALLDAVRRRDVAGAQLASRLHLEASQARLALRLEHDDTNGTR